MATKLNDDRNGDVTDRELATKLALLGREDRDAYRQVRALLWEAVVARSSYSEKPSDCS